MERGRGVERRRVFGGGLEAVPLFRHHMQKHRPGILHHLQILLQLPDVVAVDRADVAETKVLENHAAQQAGLEGVLALA